MNFLVSSLTFLILLLGTGFSNKLLNQSFEDQSQWFGNWNTVPLPTFESISGNSARTICVFARFNSNNNDECLVSIGSPNNEKDFNFCKIGGYMGVIGYNYDFIPQSGNVIHNINIWQWNQYCLTYDGDLLTIYINGEIDNTESGLNFKTAKSDNQKNYLGKCNEIGSEKYFYGEMYDFRLYDYALTQTEINNVLQYVSKKKTAEDCLRRCDDSVYSLISQYCSINDEFNDLPPFNQECVKECQCSDKYMKCLKNVGCFDTNKDWCDDWRCTCTNQCYQWQACTNKLWKVLEEEKKLKSTCYEYCPMDKEQYCVEFECGNELYECFYNDGYCSNAIKSAMNECETSHSGNMEECSANLSNDYILTKCENNNDCASKFDNLVKCYTNNKCHKANNNLAKAMARKRKQMMARNSYFNTYRRQRR